ncbi:unnamed protein product, partial [Owenia fusiformis]
MVTTTEAITTEATTVPTTATTIVTTQETTITTMESTTEITTNPTKATTEPETITAATTQPMTTTVQETTPESTTTEDLTTIEDEVTTSLALTTATTEAETSDPTTSESAATTTEEQNTTFDNITTPIDTTVHTTIESTTVQFTTTTSTVTSTEYENKTTPPPVYVPVKPIEFEPAEAKHATTVGVSISVIQMSAFLIIIVIDIPKLLSDLRGGVMNIVSCYRHMKWKREQKRLMAMGQGEAGMSGVGYHATMHAKWEDRQTHVKYCKIIRPASYEDHKQFRERCNSNTCLELCTHTYECNCYDFRYDKQAHTIETLKLSKHTRNAEAMASVMLTSKGGMRTPQPKKHSAKKPEEKKDADVKKAGRENALKNLELLAKLIKEGKGEKYITEIDSGIKMLIRLCEGTLEDNANITKSKIEPKPLKNKDTEKAKNDVGSDAALKEKIAKLAVEYVTTVSEIPKPLGRKHRRVKPVTCDEESEHELIAKWKKEIANKTCQYSEGQRMLMGLPSIPNNQPAATPNKSEPSP